MRMLFAFLLALFTQPAHAMWQSRQTNTVNAITYVGPADVISGANYLYALRAPSLAAKGQAVINVCNSTGGVDVGCADMVTNRIFGSLVSSTIAGIPCPGTNCTIKTWYDLSGNGKDATQATVALRPALNASCAGAISDQPCAFYNNTVGNVAAGTAISQPFTMNVVADRRSTHAVYQGIFAETNPPTFSNYHAIEGEPGTTWQMGSNNLPIQDVNVPDDHLHINQSLFNNTSSSFTSDNNTTSGTIGDAVGMLAPDNVYIGSDTNGCWCNIVEAGIWAAAFSTAQRLNFCGNQQAFWVPLQECVPEVFIVPAATFAQNPGLVQLANGTLFVTYRVATNDTSTDGVIHSQFSTDGGLTWQGDTVVVANPGGGNDARNGGITLLPNGDVIESYIISGNAQTTGASFWIYGTVTGNTVSWGTPVAIGTGQGAAYMSVINPAERLANGTFLQPVYWCQTPCPVNEVAGVVPFTVSGTTITPVSATPTVVASNAAIDYSELDVVQKTSGELVGLVRNENAPGYTQVTSNNNGATWTVGSVVISVAAGIGKPELLDLGSHLLMVGRTGGTSTAMGAFSTDAVGASWAATTILGVGFSTSTYVSVIRLQDGRIGTAQALGFNGMIYQSYPIPSIW